MRPMERSFPTKLVMPGLVPGIHVLEPFSASMESKRGSGFFDVTRFLDANRFPLRLKTL
jgi:hypothetical protein